MKTHNRKEQIVIQKKRIKKTSHLGKDFYKNRTEIVIIKKE